MVEPRGLEPLTPCLQRPEQEHRRYQLRRSPSGPGVVEPRGLEPLTPCLQSRCATNCAKAPEGSCRPRSGLLDRVGRLLPEVLLVAARVDLLLHEDAAGD